MRQHAATLNHLFARFEGLYLELTYLDPNKHYGLKPHIFTESYRIGYQRISWEHVAEQNARGYGVYYGITPKRRPTERFRRSKELDAAFLGALWVDIDLKDGHYAALEDAFCALAAYHPSPTIIIETGGGLHGIWRIEPVPVLPETLPTIKAHLRGLAQMVKGDPAVAETARVLRLPGTINTKPERNGARCRFADPLGIYDGTHHIDQFPRAEVVQHQDRPVRSAPPESLPHYVRWYLTTTHPEGVRNGRLNWTAFKMYQDGFSQQDASALLRDRAIASGLDARAVDATLESPWKVRK